MAEKDYDTWLAEAKAALDGYSAEQEAFAKLYEKAKQNAANAYDAQQKQLAAQTAQSKNQAAAETKKTERNIHQTLASRGLAFSGENAQTHLDLNLNLQNRLASLDRDASAQSQELERQKTQALTDLDLAHADARLASAEKRAELQKELASIAAQKQASQTQTDAGTDSETGAGDKNTTQTGMPNLKGKTLGERIRLMLEYIAKQKGTPAADAGFTPGISARDLAKQLVKSASGGNAVSTYEEQELLTVLLDSLADEHDLNETYYDELMLNLRSMGYRPDYTGESDRRIKEVCSEANEVYTEQYKRYYDMYRMIGSEAEECDRMAGELASFQKLAYIYERCESLEQFEAAVKSMDMENRLTEFYQKVKISDGEYKLGSEIDRR